MSARRHDAIDWLLLLTLVSMWGTSFMLNEIALATMPPATLVAARLVIGAAMLIAIVVVLRLPVPRSGRTWGLFTLLAAAGNCVPFYLIAWGQQTLDSGLSGILVGFMPLVTLALAHRFVPGERMTAARIGGFLLGFGGLVTLLGPAAFDQWRGGGAALAGQLACLGAAVCYASNAVMVKRMRPVHVLVVSTWTTVIAAVAMVALALVVDGVPATAPAPAAIATCVWLGLGPTAVATIVYFRLIARAGPTFMSFVNYMNPIVAVLAGALLLDEPVHAGMLVALALVLTGIAIATRVGTGAARR